MLLSGAIPRELPDLLAVVIIVLSSVEAAYSQLQIFTIAGSGIIVLLVPLTTALAALSNSAKRESEELALFAYGGSPWQIRARHVLRGCIIVALGLFPTIIVRLAAISALVPGGVTLLLLVALGGISYTIPGVRRTRSLDFVEQYKG